MGQQSLAGQGVGSGNHHEVIDSNEAYEGHPETGGFFVRTERTRAMVLTTMPRFGAMMFALGALGGATCLSARAQPAASTAPCGGAFATPTPNALFAEIAPAPNATVTIDRPFVYVRFASAVDPKRTTFQFDGKDYTSATMRWSTGLMLLEQRASAGCHTARVTVTTNAGVTSDRAWTFTSGATAAKTVLAYYAAPEAGDAVPEQAFVNGSAAPNARIIAVTGVGPSAPSNDGPLLENAAVAETSADGDGTFYVSPKARFDASHHGVLMIAAVDPTVHSISFGGVYGLHAPSRWCPLGAQHLGEASKDPDLTAFDAAQNALCNGEIERAEKMFASDAASMLKNRVDDGTRWLDYAQSYFLTLLLTGKNDEAERFFRSISKNRQPIAADRLFFSGRYDDALAAYALARKKEVTAILAVGGKDETSDSYKYLLAGNEAARERHWEGAYLAWMDAARVRHSFIAGDVFDDWNLDALGMMYYYRAHVPR